MLLQEFASEDSELKAQIFEMNYVYKVILFNNNKIVDIKEFRGKTIDSIREYCQNYVQRVMQL